ncbi:uncharacterized protein BP5553_07449 [Venustampulla echinocandica]|uniref:Uncharacterized protein n=1 Tax=Venustampulla echinocandica TaxID=2656787 RepID=A0A370TGK2_9HELO|nr:uncharacterized protein BP5553_07449 [Venustampulla echinocandica]RDL34321.1 hypothetical protein BP5553_07449 [Venustampulla echinocandica]
MLITICWLCTANSKNLSAFAEVHLTSCQWVLRWDIYEEIEGRGYWVLKIPINQSPKSTGQNLNPNPNPRKSHITLKKPGTERPDSDFKKSSRGLENSTEDTSKMSTNPSCYKMTQPPAPARGKYNEGEEIMYKPQGFPAIPVTVIRYEEKNGRHGYWVMAQEACHFWVDGGSLDWPRRGSGA